MYRALKTFSGIITMVEGEVRDILDQFVIDDLLGAGYIEEVKTAKKRLRKEEKDEPDKQSK